MWNLDWFTKWNRENPTDIYGPAIVIGAAFGAVVVAALVVAWGYPFATASVQTGPPGAGMSYVSFAGPDGRGPVDPDAARYEEIAAAAVVDAAAGGDGPGAGDLSGSPLSGLAPERAEELVAAMRAWTGIEDLFAEDNYQTRVGWRMIAMTQALNEEWSVHVGENGVNCFTCHRGQPVPSHIWFRVAPGLETVEGWSAVQNLATRQTVSTSLPHDALEKYLLEDNVIAVHDLESRVPEDVTDPETRTWQDTERTYSLMNYFSASLGRNCVFCHNSRAFYDAGQVTPQWATASVGIQMVRELNGVYLETLEGEYPPERLGPKHQDAPKAACRTCHKGYAKPMGGVAMVDDWPELAAAP